MKKLIALILVGVILLAGCGKEKNSPDAPGTEPINDDTTENKENDIIFMDVENADKYLVPYNGKGYTLRWLGTALSDLYTDYENHDDFYSNINKETEDMLEAPVKDLLSGEFVEYESRARFEETSTKCRVSVDDYATYDINTLNKGKTGYISGTLFVVTLKVEFLDGESHAVTVYPELIRDHNPVMSTLISENQADKGSVKLMDVGYYLQRYDIDTGEETKQPLSGIDYQLVLRYENRNENDEKVVGYLGRCEMDKSLFDDVEELDIFYR